MIAADHPLSLGCISRLGAVQDVFLESDLLISFGARLTEFDTGRFGLKLPPQHIQVVEDSSYAGTAFLQRMLVGEIGRDRASSSRRALLSRSPWCDIAGIKARESERLEALEPG